MKKGIDVVLTAVHLAVGIALLLVTQYLSQVITILAFRGNPVAFSTVSSILYVLLILLLTPLYARLTEHITITKLGIIPKLPSPVWLAVGLALPLGVTLFYVLFTSGEFMQTSNEVALVLASVTLSSAVAGPTEEIIFRGMLLRSLQKRWGTAVGVIVPSFMFAAIHIVMMSDVTPISYLMLLVSGTLVGIMFSLITLYSGSIWPSSLVHALWNVTIIGGILSIHAPGSGVTEMSLYEYELASSNLFLTGGIYGIECSLPAMIGFVIISAVLLWLMKNRRGTAAEN